MGHPSSTRWPLSALTAVLDPCTDDALAARLGVSPRCIERWKIEGIPDEMADAAAIRCGLIAELVWANWNRDPVGRLFDSLRAEVVA